MGLIDKITKYGLSKMPPLRTALGKVPLFTTLKWTYKAAKFGWETGTAADNRFHLSDKGEGFMTKKLGTASKGLIDKADRAEQLYHKSKDYYDKGKGLVEKGVKWGEQKLEKALQKMTGGSTIAPQNTPPSASSGKKVTPAHSTSFPKTTGKTLSPNLPDIPHYQLHPKKLGSSLHLKSYKSGLHLNATKSHVDLRALANHKLFTIKPQADKLKLVAPKLKISTIKPIAKASSFNVLKSKAFTITPLTKASTFKPIKSKAFSMKPSGTSKFNTPKIKMPTPVKTTPKFSLTNKSVFKSPSISKPFRPAPISRQTIKPLFKK